ncbi:uncharacterized protein N7515_004368 [Penicillium bovifimosum]|uniref:Uncharacterized protein n=1 Tax=Penicillium bovifimosum TaxID=126998 RepID=A0A9W9L2C5_9EURO|nr:uncharacterized protein N7515_004368 [Penicillium bovifimosum]KAJ5135090.1 hypothetical protein N7515_004368 [Penicillium bovifimosum]
MPAYSDNYLLKTDINPRSEAYPVSLKLKKGGRAITVEKEEQRRNIRAIGIRSLCKQLQQPALRLRQAGSRPANIEEETFWGCQPSAQAYQRVQASGWPTP